MSGHRHAQLTLFWFAVLAIGAGTALAVALLQDTGPDLPGDEAKTVAGLGIVAMVLLFALFLVGRRVQRNLSRANQQLVDDARRRRALLDVSDRLARALSEADVLQALYERLPEAIGAAAVVVALRDGEGRLALLRDEPRAVETAEVIDPPPAGTLVDAALHDGTPAWLRSPLDWRGDVTLDALAGPAMSMALLPLHAEDVTGVLGVAFGRVHVFIDEERTVLATIGVLAAQALNRGRRFDAEHRTAIAFQRAALPDAIPTIPNLSVAARYRPATRRAAVGGDWYEVLPLADGRVLLVVGDVVGHGMEAAAAMGRLRTAFQSLAPLQPDPGELLRVVGQQTHLIPNSLCTTALCAVLDPRSGTVTWARAGHVPPVLLATSGASVLVDRGAPPLGVSADGPPVHLLTLAAGDRLVLVTDGVVERRGEPIDDGMARLRIVAEALADLDPEDFADALVEATVPLEEQTDDVIVLVVRYDG